MIAVALLSRFRLQLAAALLILLALGFWSHHQYAKGRGDERAVWQARVAKAEARAKQLSGQLAANAAKAGSDATEAQARIVTRTKTIIQRIPADVPKGSAADVVLGAGWVRNYNAGLGLPDDPTLAGKPADQPAISAADALAGIDGNSAECLRGWDAYQRVVRLYDEAREKVNGTPHTSKNTPEGNGFR
ncbi:hypothetical protein [Phenylobacterium soli]|uniref:Uncharacterized protein n=1 Tax=Phenylobacterium soli TaxID=2170551 RepID=A0A328A956_9CAUL|nr:hypothetical protein [Phenylobacterium soli]RAK51182.1 hypothetical protein DJ017_19685 [Phenylobacterium soli]